MLAGLAGGYSWDEAAEVERVGRRLVCGNADLYRYDAIDTGDLDDTRETEMDIVQGLGSSKGGQPSQRSSFPMSAGCIICITGTLEPPFMRRGPLTALAES